MVKRSFLAFAFSALVLTASSAQALEVKTKFDLQANGLYRSLSQQGFTEANHTTDGLFFFGTQILVSQGPIEFEVRHELRSIFGDSPLYTDGDPARLSIRSADRFFHTDWRLVDNPGIETISDFERLRASYLFSTGEVWVGRRPVSLGTLSFFKVWNKFTRPVAGLFGPTIIYGSDGAGFSLQLKNVSVRGFAIFGNTPDDDASLVEATIYSDFAEFRLLGGQWWNNAAAGFAFSRNVFDWMLRGEFLYLNNPGVHGDKGSEVQYGMGLDGAISADWSLLLEGYYQSIGAQHPNDYALSDPSQFTNLRAKYYGFGLLSWQASALFKFGLGDLVNLIDSGQIGLFRINYSLSSETELLFEANVPFSKEGTEFSKRSFVFENGNYLGTGTQLTLGLKTAF